MLLGLTATAKPTETAKPTTSAEHITKHGEDVVHGETTSAETSKTAHATQSFESELVVLLAFLRVVKYVVCLGSFLEFLFSVLVARVAVGVIFDGDAPVCFLDVLLGSILVYA